MATDNAAATDNAVTKMTFGELAAKEPSYEFESPDGTKTVFLSDLLEAINTAATAGSMESLRDKLREVTGFKQLTLLQATMINADVMEKVNGLDSVKKLREMSSNLPAAASPSKS